MAASSPTHYSLIFASGRTGFEYSGGIPFGGCVDVQGMMNEPTDGVQRRPGIAFRLGNGGLVIARPGGRALRLARAS